MECANTTVHLEGLEVRAFVGLHAPERNRPQIVVVDIDCTLEKPEVKSDDLLQSADYGPIAEKVRALALVRSRRLIETLAEEIAQVCLENSRVRECRIRVRKPRKLSGCEFVGITRTFFRKE